MRPPSLDIVNRAIGLELERTRYSYNQRDVALYALGIGAPADPLDQDELKFVYELSGGGFQVIPTFAVIFSKALNDLFLTGDIAGIKYNPMMVVHGEQQLEILQPLPPAATVESTSKIIDIQDKGSGLLLIIHVDSHDIHGEKLAAAQTSIFIRGLGGFGGKRGNTVKIELPDRPPDIIHKEQTQRAQALLYRLSGDANPLHADPQMAALGNYDKPILHGLCTFGFAARAILKRCCDNQANRLRSIGVRFSHHVFPGETLITEIWQVSPGEIRFQTKAEERDAVVLSQAWAKLGE